MDLEHARTLITVVDTASITAAADKLGVTRPTVRRRLSMLEEELGVALVVPDSNGITATQAGQLYVQHARRLIRDHETLHEVVRNLGSSPTGLMDIALPVGIGKDFAERLVGVVLQGYPGVRFRVRSGIDPVSELNRGALCALTFTRPTEGAYIVKVLVPLDLRLFASAAYLEREGTPADVGDLANHTLLQWSTDVEPAEEWPLLDGGAFAIQPRMVASNLRVVQDSLAAGHGIGLLPRFSGRDLVPVLPELVGDVGNLWWVGTAASAADPRMQLMYGVLAQLLQNMLDSFNRGEDVLALLDG